MVKNTTKQVNTLHYCPQLRRIVNCILQQNQTIDKIQNKDIKETNEKQWRKSVLGFFQVTKKEVKMMLIINNVNQNVNAIMHVNDQYSEWFTHFLNNIDSWQNASVNVNRKNDTWNTCIFKAIIRPKETVQYRKTWFFFLFSK